MIDPSVVTDLLAGEGWVVSVEPDETAWVDGDEGPVHPSVILAVRGEEGHRFSPTYGEDELIAALREMS